MNMLVCTVMSMDGMKKFSGGSHQLTTFTQETVGLRDTQAELAHIKSGNGSLLTDDFKNLQMQKTGSRRLLKMKVTAMSKLILTYAFTESGMWQLLILLSLDFIKQFWTSGLFILFNLFHPPRDHIQALTRHAQADTSLSSSKVCGVLKT